MGKPRTGSTDLSNFDISTLPAYGRLDVCGIWTFPDETITGTLFVQNVFDDPISLGRESDRRAHSFRPFGVGARGQTTVGVKGSRHCSRHGIPMP